VADKPNEQAEYRFTRTLIIFLPFSHITLHESLLLRMARAEPKHPPRNPNTRHHGSPSQPIRRCLSGHQKPAWSQQRRRCGSDRPWDASGGRARWQCGCVPCIA
jgi:hypothetical protein